MSDSKRDIGRPISSSEITPERLFFNRRDFVRAGLVAATVAATGYTYRQFNRVGMAAVDTPQLAGLTAAPTANAKAAGFHTDEPKTPIESVAGYNNFYEFTTDKEGVATLAKGFASRPWTVEIGGLVSKPKTFDLDAVLKLSAPEERVYRMRCVEGWSMVIPWAGFSLSTLLNAVEPTSAARYVTFVTLNDPKRFPGQRRAVLPWPYVEGLRMDEAMHPLTLLASGLYGRELPGQNGAPLRLVLPWKYGFKGIKSIVKITLVDKEPPSTWNLSAPNEYGFYANVNPTVDHPRWSQATEERIGVGDRQPTLMFNGYGEQVAGLYSGMDLRANF